VLKEIKTSSVLYYCSEHSPWRQKTIFRSYSRSSRNRKVVGFFSTSSNTTTKALLSHLVKRHCTGGRH